MPYLKSLGDQLFEIEASEKKYRTLFNSINEGFCIIEVLFDSKGIAYDYRFLEANNSFERHTGIVDSVGRTMREIASRHEQHWFDIYGRIAQTGEAMRFENEARELGRYFDVYAFRTGHPEQRHVAIIFNDITERKKAEKALREATELRVNYENIAQRTKDKYLKIINSMHEGFCTVECIFNAENECIDFRYIDINPAFEKITGFKNVLGKTVEDLIPGHNPASKRIFGKVALTGEPFYTENYQDVQNRTFSIYAFRIDETEKNHVAVIFNDITERKRAEEKQVYLLKLSDAIRNLNNPEEIKETACRVLGQHLGVSRVMYSDNVMKEGKNYYQVAGQFYVDTPFPGDLLFAGDYKTGAAALYEGRILTVEDVTKEISEQERNDYLQFNIRSLVAVPLLKSGKLTLIFSVNDSKPRKWREDEIKLVEETAERTWAAVERAKAEAELEKSEKKLRKLNDQLDLSIQVGKIGIWNYDLKNNHLHWNKQQCELYGIEETEFDATMEGFWKFVNAEDRKRLEKESHEAFFLKKTNLTQQFRIVRKDGTERWLESRNRTQYDEQGNPSFVTGVNIDITEEKLFTRELEQKVEERTAEINKQKNLIEAIMNSTPDMVGAYDTETRIIAFNKSCEDFFNVKNEDIIGKSFVDIFPDGKGTQAENDLHRALRGETIHNKLFHSEATGRDYENYVVPLRDENGKVYAAVAIAQDITDRKVYERELKEKNIELEKINKELEAFTYASSHDLQEPLRKIRIFAGRIIEKDQEHLSEAAKGYFNYIQDAAARMQALISDLLSFSQLANSEKIFEIVHLNTIIEEVKEDFYDVIEEKKATIETSGLCEVNVIRSQFKQLVENLISNSLKFSHPYNAPHITITCEKTNELPSPQFKRQKGVIITFTDNGIGFDPKFAEKVFELFQKLHNSDDYDGTGLGLAIVKKIVENHKGHITVESELGEGTIFTIYLPA